MVVSNKGIENEKEILTGAWNLNPSHSIMLPERGTLHFLQGGFGFTDLVAAGAAGCVGAV